MARKKNGTGAKAAKVKMKAKARDVSVGDLAPKADPAAGHFNAGSGDLVEFLKAPDGRQIGGAGTANWDHHQA